MSLCHENVKEKWLVSYAQIEKTIYNFLYFTFFSLYKNYLKKGNFLPAH